MLDKDDGRRNMSEKEILEGYVDLEKLYLSDTEKKVVMGLLYKLKDAFRLKGEIGACSNIEAKTDITDISQFFIRP